MSTMNSPRSYLPNTLPIPTYDQVRAAYVISYNHELQKGTISPLTSCHFLGYNLLLTYIFFSLHPEVRRMKYLVVAIISILSVYTLLYCRTLGLAYGLGLGSLVAWPMVLVSTYIVCSEPHQDVRRLVRRSQTADPGVRQNGNATGDHDTVQHLPDGMNDKFYWQAMPTALLPRAIWVYDLVSSFRGPHWSWSIRGSRKSDKRGVTPSPSSLPTTMPSIPFRLLRCTAAYLALDALKSIMLIDGYFLSLSPSPPPLWFPVTPSGLLSWLLLRTTRSILSLLGIFCALQYTNEVISLCAYHLLPPGWALGDYSHPEFATPLFGPVQAVMDSGIIGFWNSYWHQLFRAGFVTTGRSLARQLGLTQGSPRARAFIGITAFLMSGFCHGVASYMLWGNIDQPFWQGFKAFSFFAVQPVGIALQLAILPRPDTAPTAPPRWRSRLANTAFLLIWLWATSPLFLDTLARGGLWLFEPVPLSFIRGMGWSRDRRWVCWDVAEVGWKGVTWSGARVMWEGKRWWLSGVQIL